MLANGPFLEPIGPLIFFKLFKDLKNKLHYCAGAIDVHDRLNFSQTFSCKLLISGGNFFKGSSGARVKAQHICKTCSAFSRISSFFNAGFVFCVVLGEEFSCLSEISEALRGAHAKELERNNV